MGEENKKGNYVLFISDTVPPIVNGPTILLHRLLSYFPDNSYLLLSRSSKENLGEKTDEGLRLSGQYVYVFNSSLWRFFQKLQSRSSKWKWLQVFLIFMRGLQVVRKRSVKHLFVAPEPSSGTFLLATCWLHRVTRIPMSVYFFDMFDRGQRGNWEFRMCSLIERMAVRSASNVFVMSEPLQEHYHEKYGIMPTLLHHPIDLPCFNSDNYFQKGGVKQYEGYMKIVFAGMIYEAQLDAILNLVNVVNKLSNVEFHIYSLCTEKILRWMGVVGHHVIFHGSVPHSEISNILQNADVLFLPMAFEYVYPHMVEKIPPDELRKQLTVGRKIVETASPSKLPEYLVAGRPILIHAPSFSYIAWYGKMHKCAEVVDKPDLEMLRMSILRLREDQNYCNYLVVNARKAAEQHNVIKVSKRLQQCLGVVNL